MRGALAHLSTPEEIEAWSAETRQPTPRTGSPSLVSRQVRYWSVTALGTLLLGLICAAILIVLTGGITFPGPVIAALIGGGVVILLALLFNSNGPT